MKDIATISRRAMIRILVAGVGTLAIPENGSVRRSTSVLRLPYSSLQPLLQKLAGQECAAWLGAEYIRLVPNEASISALFRFLAPLNESHCDVRNHEQEVTPASIHKRHRDDFREGRVLKIHGWTFSRTELRLYALVDQSRYVRNPKGSIIGPMK